jgi:hypothetical protein
MAQIGTPLTSAIPAVSSAGPAYATAVNAVLTELKEAVEGTVPYSNLSGSILDLNNVPVDNAEYVRFYDSGVVPSSAIDARIVYAAGEFWFVNATGAIQITSGAGLNAASLGGISGDYGGANPASVRFVDSATRYDFYDDFSTLTWGYVRSRGIDISAGAVSSFYCQVRFAGAASYTLTLPPAKPTSGRSVVVMDDTGELFFNDSTNTVENDIRLTGTADHLSVLHTQELFSEVMSIMGNCDFSGNNGFRSARRRWIHLFGRSRCHGARNDHGLFIQNTFSLYKSSTIRAI